ncbi:hypothetical protein [Chromobacterium rhizoryzae]|uniref:hypothetical protein n=1 Tax=Chromobacterium rhizoryzae TaxID=1778675 RepID=UPI001D05C5C9|nr:hypothetical protein [Chromobacterium rhizoryzae]
MAGFIHISDEVGCSMGSQDFRVLLQAIRDSFEVDEDGIVSDLYEYFDATSDCLLVLKGRDGYIFNSFCKATQIALNRDPSLYEAVGIDLIDELLGKLRCDPRYID